MSWTTREGAMKHRAALLRAAKHLDKRAYKTKTPRLKKMYREQAGARRAIAKTIDVRIRKPR